MTPAVIFDMDGVLIDSSDAHRKSWRLLADEQGLTIPNDQFSATFGRPARDIVRMFFDPNQNLDERRVRQLDDRKEELFRDLIRDDIPVIPGAIPLLADLAAADVPLALGTSGPPENVNLVLDGLDIRRYFRGIVSGFDVQHGKPDPQVFLLAAKQLAVRPEQCIVIEDAPAGIEAARRAGMKAVALTGSYDRERLIDADVIVDRLDQLTPQSLTMLVARP